MRARREFGALAPALSLGCSPFAGWQLLVTCGRGNKKNFIESKKEPRVSAHSALLSKHKADSGAFGT